MALGSAYGSLGDSAREVEFHERGVGVLQKEFG